MQEPVIAVGFPSEEAERQCLAAAVGARRIEDIRRAPADATLVLVPPCSPQALRALRRAYPAAAIVVVDEATHPERGAVFRALDAGAAGYTTPADLHELGDRLRRRRADEPFGRRAGGVPQPAAAEVA